MKKITLIFCLICCFACQNQQEDKEFDFLYAQYLEYLNENENLVFGIESNTIRHGKRADDISVLKQAEILIVKRKKFLKLLNLQDPNFVLDKQTLRSYSQFLFDYHMDCVKIESAPTTEVLELVEKSPTKKNILFALIDLARIETSFVNRSAEKTASCNQGFRRYYYTDSAGKVGKDYHFLIPLGGRAAKMIDQKGFLDSLMVKMYKNDKEIKVDFRKQFFYNPKILHLTFLPTQTGKYTFSALYTRIDFIIK